MANGDGFDLLADETRASILRELATARRESPRDPAVPFSALRDRVGIADSGRFNYHLGELTGHFVESREDGYRLSPVGQRAASSLLAGAYSDPPDRGPVELDESCGRCGEPLEAVYEDGVLRVGCGDDQSFGDAVPPGVLADTSLAEAARVLDATLRADVSAVRRDTCAACHGRVDWRFETDIPADVEFDVAYVAVCQSCGHQFTLNPGLFVFDHPAVVSAYHDAGVDVRERPLWAIECCLPGAGKLVSTEPPRVEVAAGPDRGCEFRLDGTGDVVDGPGP
jgi:hypothetical protein